MTIKLILQSPHRKFDITDNFELCGIDLPFVKGDRVICPQLDSSMSWTVTDICYLMDDCFEFESKIITVTGLKTTGGINE